MQPLSVTVEPTGSRATPAGAVVIKISGELGIDSMVGSDGKFTGVGEDNALSAALNQVLAGRPTLVVADMSETSYLSSIGIGAMIRFSNQLQQAGGTLRLAAVTSMVLTLLRRSHLESAFQIYPDIDSALAA